MGASYIYEFNLLISCVAENTPIVGWAGGTSGTCHSSERGSVDVS